MDYPCLIAADKKKCDLIALICLRQSSAASAFVVLHFKTQIHVQFQICVLVATEPKPMSGSLSSQMLGSGTHSIV